MYNVRPGFTDDVFQELSLNSGSMTADETESVLLFDKMSIRKVLEYNPKLYVVEGYEVLGPLGIRNSCNTRFSIHAKRVKTPVENTISLRTCREQC